VHPLPPPPEAVNHQRACIVRPLPSAVPSAAQSPCVVSSTLLLSSCRPTPDRLTVVSPLHPCLARPPPPPLIVLSAAHPLFYLIVVCWIGRDRTWSPIRCLALSAPSLSSCYPPPSCFASCSPTTRLPYFLIVMYWLMSLPSLERYPAATVGSGSGSGWQWQWQWQWQRSATAAAAVCTGSGLQLQRSAVAATTVCSGFSWQQQQSATAVAVVCSSRQLRSSSRQGQQSAVAASVVASGSSSRWQWQQQWIAAAVTAAAAAAVIASSSSSHGAATAV
jgi:hypothetical protein